MHVEEDQLQPSTAIYSVPPISDRFSIQRETSGRVSQAFYPTNDAGHSLAFKKSIAQMLSIDMQAGEREFDGNNLIVHLQTAGSGLEKEESKVWCCTVLESEMKLHHRN